MTSTKTDFNIMFTCAGRRVALMQTFRAALSQLGLTGKIIATDITPASAAIQKADLGLVVPEVGDKNYVAALLQRAKEHNVKLLVPMTDIDLIPLAKHRDDFARFGCTVMIGSTDAVAACVDKYKTHEMLQAAGVPTIKTLSLSDFLAGPFYPCFVKPVKGSASVGSAVILCEKDLHSHIEIFGEKLIVQEYLSGQEYTIDLYRSRDGKIRCVVPRQRLVVRSGEVEKGITIFDPKVIDASVRVASLLEGLWGVFCCQCRRDDKGELFFFEVNPRFGGGAPLSIAAGANLPLYLLQDVLGLPITAEIGQFTDRLLMLRFDDAAFVQMTELGNLPGFRSPQFR